MTARPRLRLHADFAGLERGQQRRVTRRDTEFALGTRTKHHARVARKDLSSALTMSDVNVLAMIALRPGVLAFFDGFFDGPDI